MLFYSPAARHCSLAAVHFIKNCPGVVLNCPPTAHQPAKAALLPCMFSRHAVGFLEARNLVVPQQSLSWRREGRASAARGSLARRMQTGTTLLQPGSLPLRPRLQKASAAAPQRSHGLLGTHVDPLWRYTFTPFPHARLRLQQRNNLHPRHIRQNDVTHGLMRCTNEVDIAFFFMGVTQ